MHEAQLFTFITNHKFVTIYYLTSFQIGNISFSIDEKLLASHHKETLVIENDHSNVTFYISIRKCDMVLHFEDRYKCVLDIGLFHSVRDVELFETSGVLRESQWF